MQIKSYKTRLFKNGEVLSDFVIEHLPEVQEKDIIVIASKIASLSERRVVSCSSEKELTDLIKKESDFYLETKWIPLTIKDGLVMAAAGIDQSNVDAGCVLLPEDSYKLAAKVRKELQQHYQVSELGVVITDSRVFPLRQGIVGGAIAYAGIIGLRDYRGKKDLYGRKFVMESLNIVDSIASAAVLTMGEGDESQPLALVSEAPVEFTNEVANKEDLKIPLEDDLYGPLFKRL